MWAHHISLIQQCFNFHILAAFIRRTAINIAWLSSLGIARILSPIFISESGGSFDHMRRGSVIKCGERACVDMAFVTTLVSVELHTAATS